MSRDVKEKKPTAPTKPRFNDVQFINWSLDADHKMACKNWSLDLEQFDNLLTTLVEGGYKATVSYDTYRSCFTASIVPTPDAKGNQGYILTGKGSTPTKALKQALYIHFHVMNEDWAAYSTAKSAEELDD
jgi:hypothetical protein